MITACLEVMRERDRLRFKFEIKYTIKPPIIPYNDDVIITEEKLTEVKDDCYKKLSSINKKIQKGFIQTEALREFKEFGFHLGTELLPHKIKSELDSLSKGSNLILTIDDYLIHIPWELIFLDGIFLCQKFNIGRIVNPNENTIKTEQKIEKYRRITQPLNMFILANPGNDLDSAEREGNDISEKMDVINPDNDITLVEASLDSQMPLKQVLFEIQQSHILHFAGHAEYDPDNPNVRRWKLANNEYLTVKEVDKMFGSAQMPILILSNACQSACAEKWTSKSDMSSDLVNAFLRAGVRCFIGTLCKIVDKPSSYFATAFYSFLIKGKTVGEAVRLSREALIKKYGENAVGWASYVMYGDPTLRFFDENKNILVEDNNDGTQEINKPNNNDENLQENEKDISKKNEIENILDTNDSEKKITDLIIEKEILSTSTRDKKDEEYSSVLTKKNKGIKNKSNLIFFIIKLIIITSAVIAFLLLLAYIFIIIFEMWQARDIEDKTTELIKKLNERIISDKTTNEHQNYLTIAIDYSSLAFVFYGMDKHISSDIIRNIQNKDSNFYTNKIKFLERKRLYIILKELDLKNSSTESLKKVRLFLYLEFQWGIFKSIIYSSLIDVESGETFELKDFELKNKSIKTRRKISNEITKELLIKLNEIKYLIKPKGG